MKTIHKKIRVIGTLVVILFIGMQVKGSVMLSGKPK